MAIPANLHHAVGHDPEFLVKDAVPLDMVTCVIAKTPAMEQNLRQQMASSNWNIPILVKPGCYFS